MAGFLSWFRRNFHFNNVGGIAKTLLLFGACFLVGMVLFRPHPAPGPARGIAVTASTGAAAAAASTGAATGGVRVQATPQVAAQAALTAAQASEVASLKAEVKMLKRMFRNYAMWRPDPWFAHEGQCGCKKSKHVGGKNKNEEYLICLDGLEERGLLQPGSCVVYDMGIRKEPEFGLEMSEVYGCEVHAFDPSPITKKWLEDGPFKERDVKNYHFHTVGVAGNDGKLKVWESDWGQISITRPYPNPLHPVPWRAGIKEYSVDVKSPTSIMKELGHKKIDILKLDVEGSEYLILQDFLDAYPEGEELPFHTVLLELHHFDIDTRYGVSPQIALLVGELMSRGFKMFTYSTYWSNDKLAERKYQETALCRWCCESGGPRNVF